ncbi:hypothetical protein [Ponticaulis profundi]|uniref:Uncharacterized protein n=1 Tax=Ponticaulis profundi TaxID=2665222 RepID=A0ABW1SCH4_9PROT
MRGFRMNARLSRLFATQIDTLADRGTLQFEAGQVWEIDEGEFSGVQLLVVKTEMDEDLGQIVHVTVRGPLQTLGGSELDGIPHLPFLHSALDQSDLTLAGHVERVPGDWRPMYDDWVQDAEEDEAGVFSLSAGRVLGDIMARLPI